MTQNNCKTSNHSQYFAQPLSDEKIKEIEAFILKNSNPNTTEMPKEQCDICSCDLELYSIAKTKKKYLVKRYKCPICGFEKTIFGGWLFDHSDDVQEV